MKGHLAKPTDVGTDLAAAGAVGYFGRRFVEGSIGEGRARTGFAAALEEFPVHMENALRASEFVEIVNVLGAQEEAVLKSLFEGGESKMAVVRLGCGGNFAAHGIEIPYEMGSAPPGKRRGDFFNAIVAPESANIAKGGDAAFGADACTCKDKNAIGGRNN